MDHALRDAFTIECTEEFEKMGVLEQDRTCDWKQMVSAYDAGFALPQVLTIGSDALVLVRVREGGAVVQSVLNLGSVLGRRLLLNAETSVDLKVEGCGLTGRRGVAGETGGILTRVRRTLPALGSSGDRDCDKKKAEGKGEHGWSATKPVTVKEWRGVCNELWNTAMLCHFLYLPAYTSLDGVGSS